MENLRRSRKVTGFKEFKEKKKIPLCVKASLKLVSSGDEFHVEVEDVIQHFVN